MYKSGKGEGEEERNRVIHILWKREETLLPDFLTEVTSDRTKNANGAMHALVYITN